MQLAESLLASWKAQLQLSFEKRGDKSVLAKRLSDGPLVVQKPLYPEGDAVCHAIVVHPPGGIAGGDELQLVAGVEGNAHALLTTPGAGKWYRTAGPWARQSLRFELEGVLEWLPRETIVFDGALAHFETEIRLRKNAKYLGWEVVCLGRRGSGERFDRGALQLETRVFREEKLLFLEKGRVDGGGRLMSSPVGLGGRSVFGTMMAIFPFSSLNEFRKDLPDCIALTSLPGVLIARYLGDSGEEALQGFSRLWKLLRPTLAGRAAVEPRIWST